MRLLGVDFGFARIGLAVVEAEHPFPRPMPTLASTGVLKRDARALADAAAREQADAIVLGLPLEPDGSAGKMARIVRRLAECVGVLGPTVHLVDERLTSVEAESSLQGENLKASERAKRRDAESACRILERYLAAGESVESPDVRAGEPVVRVCKPLDSPDSLPRFTGVRAGERPAAALDARLGDDPL